MVSLSSLVLGGVIATFAPELSAGRQGLSGPLLGFGMALNLFGVVAVAVHVILFFDRKKRIRESSGHNSVSE